MRTQAVVSWLLCVSAAACASSQAEQVRDARMEQIDAQTVARTRVIEDRQRAREEAIERNYDSAKANVERGPQPDKEAANDALDASEERALYQSKAVGRMDTIRVRIDAARNKLPSAKPSAQELLRRELLSSESEYQGLQQKVQNFPSAPTDDWESAMESLDDRITQLNERVKSLTAAIEDAE
jgi:hypothetical protein